MRHDELLRLADNLNVSIHASVKDATGNTPAFFNFSYSFNPRICKRCDKQARKFKDGFSGFNPRICKRCDVVVVGLIE